MNLMKHSRSRGENTLDIKVLTFDEAKDFTKNSSVLNKTELEAPPTQQNRNKQVT